MLLKVNWIKVLILKEGMFTTSQKNKINEVNNNHCFQSFLSLSNMCKTTHTNTHSQNFLSTCTPNEATWQQPQLPLNITVLNWENSSQNQSTLENVQMYTKVLICISFPSFGDVILDTPQAKYMATLFIFCHPLLISPRANTTRMTMVVPTELWQIWTKFN